MHVVVLFVIVFVAKINPLCSGPGGGREDILYQDGPPGPTMAVSSPVTTATKSPPVPGKLKSPEKAGHISMYILGMPAELPANVLQLTVFSLS